MTEKQHEIPFKDVTPSTMKRRSKINELSIFLLILVGLGIFFTSPIPPYLMSLVPDTYTKSIFSSVYKEVTLDDQPQQISKPIKYAQSEPLPVLGRGTGICFAFDSSISKENENAIDVERLQAASRGIAIAEIIALATDKTEYKLDNITLSDREEQSVICQMFSLRDSLFPRAVKAIYIRPIKPFTPSKVTWATAKDIY